MPTLDQLEACEVDILRKEFHNGDCHPSVAEGIICDIMEFS